MVLVNQYPISFDNSNLFKLAQNTEMFNVYVSGLRYNTAMSSALIIFFCKLLIAAF